MRIHKEDPPLSGETGHQPGSAGAHVEKSLGSVDDQAIVRNFHIGRIASGIRDQIQGAMDAYDAKRSQARGPESGLECLAAHTGAMLGITEKILAYEIATLRYELEQLKNSRPD